MRSIPRRLVLVLALTTVSLLLAACHQDNGDDGGGGRTPVVSGGPSGHAVPPAPPTPAQSLGASSPPVIWVGGLVVAVTDQQIQLQEGSGSMVNLDRLAGGATTFFQIAGSGWQQVDQPFPTPGDPACVETLLDGTSFLAVRVFLGAGCGPA